MQDRCFGNNPNMHSLHSNTIPYMVSFHLWFIIIIFCYSNAKIGTTHSFHIPSIPLRSSSTTLRLSSTTTNNNNNNNKNNFNSVFPISTRQALIERSKQINQGIIATTDQDGSGTYTATTATTSARSEERRVGKEC